MRRRSKKHWPLVHWGEGLAVGCSPPKMKIDQRNVWQALDDSFSRSRCQSDYLLAPHSSMSFVSAYRHNMNSIQGEGGKSCQWHDFEIIPISRKSISIAVTLNARKGIGQRARKIAWQTRPQAQGMSLWTHH